MFLDPKFEGWGSEPVCKGCSEPIGLSEPSSRIQFEAFHRHGLDSLNGIYHETCAKPLQSIIAAYQLLGGMMR